MEACVPFGRPFAIALVAQRPDELDYRPCANQKLLPLRVTTGSSSFVSRLAEGWEMGRGGARGVLHTV